MEPQRTVALFHWNGWNPVYHADHINALCRMIRQNSGDPPTVVVFTDEPKSKFIADEVFPLPTNPITSYRWPLNCFVRMNLWNYELMQICGIKGEVMSLDADVIVRHDINRFFGSGQDLFIGGPNGRVQYWGGAFTMQVGTNPQVWSQLTMENIEQMHRARDGDGRKFMGSDQAWLTYMLPGRQRFGKELSCDWRTLDQAPPEGPVVIQFGGKSKPWYPEGRVTELAPELVDEYRSYLL